MNNNKKYYFNKYYKEYKCNYKYDKYTYNWDIIGERDKYRCPECYYLGTKELCNCEGETIYDLY